MSELRFTREHEWIRVEEDGTAVVGITDYAQEQLGDVVYVELPEEGSQVEQGEELAVVESVKAAADVKAPAGGTVVAVNDALNDTPELVNQDPLGEGWFVRLELADPTELGGLMDEDAYHDFIASEQAED